MHPGAVQSSREYGQPCEGQKVGGAVADFVEDEAPRPAHSAGAGNRAVEVGAGQPQHQEQRRQRPDAEGDGDSGRSGRDDPGRGEGVR